MASARPIDFGHLDISASSPSPSTLFSASTRFHDLLDLCSVASVLPSQTAIQEMRLELERERLSGPEAGHNTEVSPDSSAADGKILKKIVSCGSVQDHDRSGSTQGRGVMEGGTGRMTLPDEHIVTEVKT